MNDTTAPPALVLQGVEAGYGMISVLKGIDLTIAAGEIVTLIGCNGAGKTTTLNTICGLVRARRGTIQLFGEAIQGHKTQEIVARGLTQAPEGRRLFADMTVQENLELGAYLRDDRTGIATDLERCYALFPILAQRRRQAAGQLSGGEQQMCAIARCLMARPRVMLLDEPSLGLAPIICQLIFAIIRQLNEEQRTTIFLVEQNAHAALRLAHRGYVMETGKITISGPAHQLLADPRVQEAYLGI
jgi:branched-chain amino acid transport system ATP-binding protein